MSVPDAVRDNLVNLFIVKKFLLGSNILIDNFTCFGSHGLSISVSCGNETYEQNHIENVTVRNSILMGSDNGIHIKTHVDGAPGLLQNVTYENIQFEGQFGSKFKKRFRKLSFC